MFSQGEIVVVVVIVTDTKKEIVVKTGVGELGRGTREWVVLSPQN